jgi:hypothetical protein
VQILGAASSTRFRKPIATNGSLSASGRSSTSPFRERQRAGAGNAASFYATTISAFAIDAEIGQSFRLYHRGTAGRSAGLLGD